MGKHVPWFTTLGGAYEHAAKHGSKPPYELPESWIKSKAALDLKTPFDTVSTPDIIGGNSGSPLINKNAEVVGIIFDGNIESLPWNFVYTDQVARSVATDSRAIIEVLRKVYHADALADELTGSSARIFESDEAGKAAEVTLSRIPLARQKAWRALFVWQLSAEEAFHGTFIFRGNWRASGHETTPGRYTAATAKPNRHVGSDARNFGKTCAYERFSQSHKKKRQPQVSTQVPVQNERTAASEKTTAARAALH